MATEGPAHGDVRLRGFADRVPVEAAQAWVDGRAARLAGVEVGLDEAVGRVLAAPLAAAGDHPPAARAGTDGYAVRSADTFGASAYDPLPLALRDPATPSGAGRAALVTAGAPLPPWADAVLGFEAAQPAAGSVEAVAPVAEGTGIERAGQQVRAGAPLPCAGHVLGPRDVALLAEVGAHRVSVVARPRLRLVVAGPKGGAEAGGARDAHGPMLRALVARDGGAVEGEEVPHGLRAALRHALRSPAPDLVIVTGRTGTGPDDEGPAALAEAGRLEIHGVALRPGGSAGMGLAGAVPVFLLPGDPLACLFAYELLAGRLVRALGGRDPGLPHPAVEAEVGRKIVSAVGLVEICQVRLASGRVEPIGVADFGGLAAAARADGFVVVPAALEGYAPGTRVIVHRY
jgi:molybdopterin molybdotransferase